MRTPHKVPEGHDGKHRPHLMLWVSVGVSYLAMFLLMYAMADRSANVYFNLSNVYMAGLMLPIMLLTMGGMFKNKRMNAGVWAASVVILGGCWLLLRAEAGVGDRQFLRAMIPHHSAAIQMAKESSVSDPRVKKLTQDHHLFAGTGDRRNEGDPRIQVAGHSHAHDERRTRNKCDPSLRLQEHAMSARKGGAVKILVAVADVDALVKHGKLKQDNVERQVRGFHGPDVNERVEVELAHTDVDRGSIDFARSGTS